MTLSTAFSLLQQEVISLYVGKSGAMELKQCQMIVDKALQAGHWVHLHAVHDCPDILLNLLVSINGAKVGALIFFYFRKSQSILYLSQLYREHDLFK